MNTRVTYYNAPRDFDPDPFVDAVCLPTPAIRLLAPPNAKSGHAIAAELCRSLGVTRDNFTKSSGTTHLYAAAQAWALAHRTQDVYIAHTEDLAETAVLDLIDFTGALGARLHLIYSDSQVYAHSDRLNTLGIPVAPFSALPCALRESPPTPLAAAPQPAHPLHGIELPDDPWPTFRATYRQLLMPDQSAIADDIYLDAYATIRASDATTAAALEGLAGRVWTRHGAHEAVRLITARAFEAGLFRNGYNAKIDLHHFVRRAQEHHVNLMAPAHYRALHTYVSTWRSAATVLHASHMSREAITSLRTSDVTRDGQVPALGTTLPPDAALPVSAQRWHRLLNADQPDPLMFDIKPGTLGQGIRAVVQDLDLPVQTYWRTITHNKQGARPSVTVEAITR